MTSKGGGVAVRRNSTADSIDSDLVDVDAAAAAAAGAGSSSGVGGRPAGAQVRHNTECVYRRHHSDSGLHVRVLC